MTKRHDLFAVTKKESAMAAKRHYSSEHSIRDGSYSGEYARRTQEMEDAGMIGNDRSAIANMPQEVMMKPWVNSSETYMPENLDDTARGIDMQMNKDNSQRKKHFRPEKV